MTTLSATEGTVAAWPEAMASIGGTASWSRLEAWTAWRWGVRPVTYIVQGPDEWRALLFPFTAETVEIWRGGWEAFEAPANAFGGLTFPNGQFRVTGTAGVDEAPPAEVLEAHTRLAAYFEDMNRREGTTGVSAYSHSLGNGAISESFQLDRASAAKAMQYSGAADLLRHIRRAP